MIETHCFRDLNVFGPNNSPTADLWFDCPPSPEVQGCFPFRRKTKVCFYDRSLSHACHVVSYVSLSSIWLLSLERLSKVWPLWI